MKKSMLLLLPLAAMLNACGNGDNSKASAPIANVENFGVVHNENECPANINGQFFNRETNDRRQISIERDAARRLVLVDGSERYSLTGRQEFRMQRQQFDRSRYYVAGCMQGSVRVVLRHKEGFRNPVEITDGNLSYTPSGNGVRIVEVRSNPAQTSNLQFDRQTIRPRPRPR